MLAASLLPARAAPTGVHTDEELVVFGGSDLDEPGLQYRTDAAAYDPATDSWRRLSDLPVAHTSPQAVWTGTGVLYVVGGDSRPDGRDEGSFAHVVDEDRWIAQPVPPGGARSNHAVAWSGSRLYVWGGQSHTTRRRSSRGRPTSSCRWR